MYIISYIRFKRDILEQIRINLILDAFLLLNILSMHYQIYVTLQFEFIFNYPICLQCSYIISR